MKLILKLNLIVFSLIIHSYAEPFITPDNIFVKREITYQKQNESLFFAGRWPLDFGSLDLEYIIENKQKFPNIHEKFINSEMYGFSPWEVSLGVSSDHFLQRGFSYIPRSHLSSHAEVSWMNDYFASKLSLNNYSFMEKDWKGRVHDGLSLDGSYFSARLGNWSTTLGLVDRWWGPGWDGSIILSTNAQPIPSISLDRRLSYPFETELLSWLGPWSFSSFIGRLEDERTVPNAILWGMRLDTAPAIIDGFDLGFFRIFQLGGKGRPFNFSTLVDAFLAQDNYGANTGNNDFSNEPGNQIAGVDMRWKIFDSPWAVYTQIAGEDEDNFMPNALFYQVGTEYWHEMSSGMITIFTEYTDLTSFWWTRDVRTRNNTYNHESIYADGYRHNGRAIGHWADQDSRIASIGCILDFPDIQKICFISRFGKLNCEPNLNPKPHHKNWISGEFLDGTSSVSDGVSSDYFSSNIEAEFNFDQIGSKVSCSVGWESYKNANVEKIGPSAYLVLSRKL